MSTQRAATTPLFATDTPRTPWHAVLRGLPADLLLRALGFLYVEEALGVAGVCFELRELLGSEHASRIFAHRLYPKRSLRLHTDESRSPRPRGAVRVVVPPHEAKLVRSLRLRPWRLLLERHNSPNGTWVVHTNVVSNWQYNDGELFYQNRVVRVFMGGPRGDNLTLIVDARGETDLRRGESSVMFRQALDASGEVRRLASCNSRVINASPGYQLIELGFEAHHFLPNHVYYFNFNGCEDLHGSDYECVEVFRLPPQVTLRQWLNPHLLTRRQEGSPGPMLLRRFERQPVPYTPRVWSWGLPDTVHDRFKCGNWGAGPDIDEAFQPEQPDECADPEEE